MIANASANSATNLACAWGGKHTANRTNSVTIGIPVTFPVVEELRTMTTGHINMFQNVNKLHPPTASMSPWTNTVHPYNVAGE